MDKLISGIVNSKQPVQVKEAFLGKIAGAITKCDDKDSFYDLIRTCFDIVYPVMKVDVKNREILVCEKLEQLLQSWMVKNLELSIDYVKQIFLSKKICDFENIWMKCRHIRMLLHSYNAIKSSLASGEHLMFKNYVIEYLLNEIFGVDNVCLLATFALVFLNNSDFLSTHDNTKVQVVELIVKIVSKSIPKESFQVEYEELSDISCMGATSKLFQKCVEADINVMKFSASLVFKEILNIDYKPSLNLAIFLSHLKCDILLDSFQISLSSIPDISIASILVQMLDWFFYSETKSNIDSWILVMIKYLIKHEKLNVLVPIATTKVNQLCKMVYNTSFRKESVNILTFMLLSCNNSNPFHRALDELPSLMTYLRDDGRKTATQVHQTLAELVFTLMYKFPDSNNVYDAINGVLEGLEKPSENVMKMWLNNFGATEGVESLVAMEFMHPVETGLKNLGNTCYMNSIIQALFNLNVVKKKILLTAYRRILQPVSVNLQNIFAYLHLSKRRCVEPKEFNGVSRPNWFESGRQQDCSEYMKHLLDKLQQESNDSNSIADLFDGEINACVECLYCHSSSNQKEVFNDLPLSFKSNQNKAEKPSLKGGDSSDVLGPKQVHFDFGGESSKSSAKAPLDVEPESSTDPDLSIVDLLNNYFLPELLKDTNQYFCNACQSLQDACKTMKIHKFPKYLILTLKRFTYDVSSKKRCKIMDVINYPPNLTICNGCMSCYQALGTSENTVLSYTTETDCTSSVKYRLSSVIVHAGHTSDSGHYYCYSSRYTGDKCSWYVMNDEDVYSVSDDAITKFATNVSRDTPYVCIYEQIEGENTTTPIDIPEQLIEMVENDNQLYLREEVMKRKNSSQSFSSVKVSKKDDGNNDDSPGSFGPCGGNGNDWGGARFVC